MKTPPYKFIFNSLYIIICSVYIAYLIKRSSEKGEYTFINFLHGGQSGPTLGDIVVGLTFGMAMGLATTLGIWFSLDHVEKFVNGGSKINAVISGLYSNIISMTLGSTMAIIVSSIMNQIHKEEPIYIVAIGTLIGTFFGIMIGKIHFKQVIK